MIYEFRLPDIGEGLVEGEVVRWLVKEGDILQEDQPMVEIMTDKATVEISSPRGGRVARRLYAEGQNCPVGKVLIEIDTGAVGTGPSDGPASAAKGPPAQGPPGPTRSDAAPPSGAGFPDRENVTGILETRVLATPASQ